MADRGAKIKFIQSKIGHLSHDQLVQVLHMIRPEVELENLMEKDGDILIYYDKINDDLLQRIHAYVTQSTQ